MNHEPECPTGKDWYEMCECKTLRAAYRRGREDAERDVFAAEALPFSNLLPRGVAAAAARGDGEQA